MQERALLLGQVPPRTAAGLSASLAELTRLVEAAGGIVVAQLTQARDDPGLGRGKLEEARLLVADTGATVAVYDGELTPGTARRWEAVIGIPVVDRTEVILDIFARHATSVEGRLQVEMAQLSYRLPRLSGQGRRLSRLAGGIGTRGPGETRLESDRRRIRERLAELRRALDRLDDVRSGRRERRQRSGLPLVALVGYTNVGKSTLFRALTHRWTPVADALFVTLDPTVRRVRIPGFGPALLSDTVGFVSRLPTSLVAAFRATLAEVRDASLLVRVEDAASPYRREERDAVEAVLRELGVDRVATVVVANQWDRVPPGTVPDGIPVSALTGANLSALTEAVAAALEREWPLTTLHVPWQAGEVLGWILAEGAVVREAVGQDGLDIAFRAPPHVLARVTRRLAT
jgi:GTP-binding protein HflX